MSITIIGVDCAVDSAKVGVAVGHYSTTHHSVEEVVVGLGKKELEQFLASEIRDAKRVLVAMDAPLGWPIALGEQLFNHRAGDHLGSPADSLFRRETDLEIKKRLGKQPLDVGADRIARTAKAAMDLLYALREETQRALELAWDPQFVSDSGVVEVYPAGTLIAHGLRSSGYKKAEHIRQREEIMEGLKMELQLNLNTEVALRNDNALDALVCVLAGMDFLDGKAVAPRDLDLARKEGWIWVPDK